MQRMFDKYQDAVFGHCPRVPCQDQFCLPIGLSDLQRTFPVNVYCPRCQEPYIPRSTKQAGLDGAYFGTTFAHMFLLTYPDLIPRMTLYSASNACGDTYIPKIYGFRINRESSYYKLRWVEKQLITCTHIFSFFYIPMIMLFFLETLSVINISSLNILYAYRSELEASKEDEEVRTESDRDSSGSRQQSPKIDVDRGQHDTGQIENRDDRLLNKEKEPWEAAGRADPFDHVVLSIST